MFKNNNKKAKFEKGFKFHLSLLKVYKKSV